MILFGGWLVRSTGRGHVARSRVRRRCSRQRLAGAVTRLRGCTSTSPGRWNCSPALRLTSTACRDRPTITTPATSTTGPERPLHHVSFTHPEARAGRLATSPPTSSRQAVDPVGPSGSREDDENRPGRPLLRPGPGPILIDGTDVRELAGNRSPRSSGIVFQETFWFPRLDADEPALRRARCQRRRHRQRGPGGAPDELIAPARRNRTIVGERGHSSPAVRSSGWLSPGFILRNRGWSSSTRTHAPRQPPPSITSRRHCADSARARTGHRHTGVERPGRRKDLRLNKGRLVARNHAELLARGGLYSAAVPRQFGPDPRTARTTIAISPTSRPSAGNQYGHLDESEGAGRTGAVKREGRVHAASSHYGRSSAGDYG